MKLFTLIENHKKLEKAEVEIQMIPGIPQIHFLGLPDQAIKESFLRIKSALKVCGFSFPVSQQIIVNIRPNYLKKSSKGLELAVALGILHMTEQKILSDQILSHIMYGELSLDGEVLEPMDLIQYKNAYPDEKILSGRDIYHHQNLKYRIHKLDQDILILDTPAQSKNLMRPEAGVDMKYTEDEAEVLFLFAAGKFHLLLSGPAGAGKSTIASNSISFIMPQEICTWPSLIAPHSSVTPAAFLGGGAQLYPGEIEKVHKGILFLDEFLEFDSEIVEALRAPMTGQKLRLSRAGSVREFNCDFQVAASTNLCSCGKWTPDLKMRSCRFSHRQCRKTLDRLSGPILDRFGLFYYYPQKQHLRKIEGSKILQRLTEYKLKSSKASEAKIQSESLLDQVYGNMPMRRKQALLRAAQIYAIERESGTIELQDLIKAEKWTYSSFLELEKGMS